MNPKPVDERLDPTESSKLRYGSWKTALLFAVFLLAACSYLNSRNLSYACYYLNWRYWPRWYSVNLWALAFGTAVYYFVRGKKSRYFLYAGVLLAISVVTVLYSEWLHLLIGKVSGPLRSFHYSVFRPFFYTPLTELFYNGTIK